MKFKRDYYSQLFKNKLHFMISQLFVNKTQFKNNLYNKVLCLFTLYYSS